MYLGLGLRLGGGGRVASGPGLSLSAASIAENSAQGTTVCTATPVRASNPGAVSIASQTPANSLQMNVDGVTVEVGSAGLNYETDPTISVTFEYTDDDGTYQFSRTIYVTDVADGPTITGAASDIDTELGTPTVGILTTFDARDVIVSPLGQTLTFTVSHGSVDIDGFTVNWTPVDTDVSAGSLTFTLSAVDEDGQTLDVPSSPFAVEVDITPPSFSAGDAIEGDNVTITSGSAVGATSSATYLLLNGVDVTGDMVAGVYTVPAISSDAALTAQFYAYYDGVEFLEQATITIYAVPADLVTTVQFDVVADTTAPTLSAPVGTQTGSTTADGGVTTNEGNGTIWMVTTTSATQPSAAQIKAGQDHTGAAAVFDDSLAVTTTGAKAFSVTGLTASTSYYNHYMHEDSADNQSSVSTSASFTTSSGADVTAPVLTSPVDNASGGTAATGSVDTDEGNGTLYWVVTQSATAPTAAQVKLGQDHTSATAADSGSQAVSGTGTQTLSPAPSGLTSETTYYIHFMHEDASANQSNVASGNGFTTADVTAPTLSSPVDLANGSTAATGSVSTNEGNGTLYWVVSTSGTAPSAAQVKAGNDHTGSAAADSGSQAVSGTGVQTLSPAPSGLTASTAYTIHYMHEDAAANQSSVSSGDGFTTTSGSSGLTTPPTLLGTFVSTANITQAETSSFNTSSTSILVIEVTTTNNDSTTVVMGYTDITIGDASRSFGTGTTISTTPQKSKFASRNNVQVFFFLTPAAASGQTIQIRWSDTSRSTVIKVYEYEGADRTTQDGASATNSPNGNQASSNVSLTTTYAGSAVHYAGIRNYDAAAITISGATELDQRTSGGTTSSNDHHAWSAYEDAATTGSYGASASWTGSLSQAAVGCEVKAA